jgi:hypothetical protein
MFDKRRIRKHGLSAEAMVLSVDQRSHLTTNELRDFDHVVEVRPPGEVAFQTMIREKYWIAGLRPKEGDVVKVLYDRDSREAVFDLDGDPRFDLEQMRERTKQLRRETAAITERYGEPPADWQDQLVARVAPPAAAQDPVERLDRLVKLRDAGALTPEEFEAQKTRILSSS